MLLEWPADIVTFARQRSTFDHECEFGHALTVGRPGAASNPSKDGSLDVGPPWSRQVRWAHEGEGRTSDIAPGDLGGHRCYARGCDTWCQRRSLSHHVHSARSQSAIAWPIASAESSWR